MPNATSVIIESISDLCELVRAGTPIVDYGVAHRDLGNPPPENHVALTLKSPTADGIIEHYVPDMTVRASGGATMAQLQAALAKENQFLPIDADGDVTLAEAIVHNAYGPLRLGFGGVRDLLLGLHFVDGHSRDVHAGGRTVKNVAGYDLTRFMVGSLGQFGIVHEATLRTYAIPEGLLVAEMELTDPAALDDMLTDWLLADAAPVGIVLRWESKRWALCAAYAGRVAGCAAQLRSLEALLASKRTFRIVGSDQESLAQHRQSCEEHRAWIRTDAAVVKVIVPPAATGKTCATLLEKFPTQLHIEALPAHGCIFIGGDLSSDEAVTLDQTITSAITDASGLRVWYRRPGNDSRIAPFGPPQPDWNMLSHLKRTMDPQNIFNPGRFLPTDGVSS